MTWNASREDNGVKSLAQRCCIMNLREGHAKDARKAHASVTYAGKGLNHFGRQDESEISFTNDPCFTQHSSHGF